jgi:integrase
MASIRRHPRARGQWQVRWREDGKQISENCDTLAMARVRAAEVEADKARGESVNREAGRVSFGEYAERWAATRGDLARSSRDRDQSYLRSMILPKFADRPVASIRPSEIETWLSTLDRASATRAKALRIVATVLDLARRDGAFKVNPAADVKPPKQNGQRDGRALTDDEMTAVFDAAEMVDSRTAAAVWLMARCGLRIGEVLALRRHDLDFDGGLVTVAVSMSRRDGVKAPKTDAGVRTIPMPADLAERLRRHLAEQTVTDFAGSVFVAPRGGLLRYDNWRTRTWDRIVAEADIGEVHPHDLRHTCATRLFVVDRWTPGEVQRFLGHRDPRVTLSVYTHVVAESLPTPSPIVVTGV